MIKRLLSVIFILLITVTGVYALTNQQYIVDRITVAQANIDPAVTQLVVDSGMNERGIFIYHATEPRLEDSEGFNRSCTRQEERSAILGCYVNDTIHIYDIADERLSGVREVTATHEALHAVFARASQSERDELGPLLEAEYERIVQEYPDMKERMGYYERTQPGQRINELHSIIGTEYTGLSSELEAYYSQYFSDRSKVVSLHDQYRDRFDELRNESARLESELLGLTDQINAMTVEYNSRAQQLSSKVSDFNARAQAGDFANQSAFNAERRLLLQESDQLEAYRQSINDRVALHEQKRQEFNEIVSESNSMYESLDSTLAPSPQI